VQRLLETCVFLASSSSLRLRAARSFLPIACCAGSDAKAFARVARETYATPSSTRNSAAAQANTNVDVGLAVLRRRGRNEDGSEEFECVDYIKRMLDDCVSQEIILEGGYVYHLVPFCVNQMQALAPRRVTMVVHSSNPVQVQKVPSTWGTLARAVFGVASSKGNSIGASGTGVRTFLLQEPAGCIFVAENTLGTPFGLQVDCNDSIGMVSSREGGMCGCIDAVPPSSRKVLIALAQKQGAQRMAMSFAFDALPAEAAAWAAVENAAVVKKSRRDMVLTQDWLAGTMAPGYPDKVGHLPRLASGMRRPTEKQTKGIVESSRRLQMALGDVRNSKDVL